MNTAIDYIGAMLIGGIVLLSLLAATQYQSGQQARSTLETISQDHLNYFYEMFNFDITKTGYNVPTDPAVLEADSNAITFLADLEDDGDVDTIRYYVGTVDDYSWTENPDDFPVYRQVNNEDPVSWGTGITLFRLRYYDGDGVETSTLADIKGIGLEILTQSPQAYEGDYGGAYASVTFYPMNLNL